MPKVSGRGTRCFICRAANVSGVGLPLEDRHGVDRQGKLIDLDRDG